MADYDATCDDKFVKLVIFCFQYQELSLCSHMTQHGHNQGRHMRICRAVIELLYSCPFIDACHKVVSKSSYNGPVTVAKSSLRSNIFTESSTSRLKIIFQPSESCHSSQ